MAEPALSDQDYAVIETAVMETARGRWFLAEFARRNRNTDTEALISRLDTLETRIAKTKSDAGDSQLRLTLNDMAAAIARTKLEISAIRSKGTQGDPFDDASSELDAIIASTEKATGDILSAAETLQEIGFALRETGVDSAACDLIDAKATDIYTACSFQDVTGQRTHKVVEVLRYLENRIGAMLNAWGEVVLGDSAVPFNAERASPEPTAATAPIKPLVQADVDLFMHGKELDDLVFVDPGAPAIDHALIEAVIPSEPVVEFVALDVAAPALEVPEAAIKTAAAALALPEPEPDLGEPAATATQNPPAAKTAEAPLAPVDVPGLPKVSDIEKLSFVEKSALFS